MGLHWGGLIIGRIFASEIWGGGGAYFQDSLFFGGGGYYRNFTVFCRGIPINNGLFFFSAMLVHWLRMGRMETDYNSVSARLQKNEINSGLFSFCEFRLHLPSEVQR